MSYLHAIIYCEILILVSIKQFSGVIFLRAMCVLSFKCESEVAYIVELIIAIWFAHRERFLQIDAALKMSDMVLGLVRIRNPAHFACSYVDKVFYRL